MLLYSIIQAPVPAVNEPHYLCKAKQYWNPQWCAGDLFLESSNTHLVFYQTIGLLTRWLTLEQTAWTGRLLALSLLSVGWVLLIPRLVSGRWSTIWVLWLFLSLTTTGSFSGEWIFGGVESKVFAYGFVFVGLALLLDGRWNLAALCSGLAISFHPLVGGWSLASGLFAGLICLIFRPGIPQTETRSQSISQPTRLFPTLALAGTILIASSLPGLWPAMQLVTNVSPQAAYQADFIQIFYRLAHHLNPRSFPAAAYFGYSGLLAGWLVLRHYNADRRPAERFFNWFVLGSVLTALVGLLIGFSINRPEKFPQYAFQLRLLKFYPFRLADSLVPLAFSVTLVGVLQNSLANKTSPKSWLSPIRGRRILGLLFGAALIYALVRPTPGRNPHRMTAEELADWKAVCRWVTTETSPKALIHTPRRSWAFKWYTGRAEYVSYKDCPQDAAGILEWNRRLMLLKTWSQKNFSGGYSLRELRNLREQTGITHLIAHRLGPMQIEPVYRNQTYRIYDLTRLSEQPTSR